MTAAELYEIVKDVPREAWPNGLLFDGDGWGAINGSEYVGDSIPEHAFIGSMTAFKADQIIEIKRQSHENCEMRFTVIVQHGWDHRRYEHTSLVAALAAACKEAA